MGWIDKVKTIIEKLRGTGKNEREIERIVRQAAEVATVTQAADKIQEAAKAIKQSERLAAIRIAEGIAEMGVMSQRARDALDAFAYAVRAMERITVRKETNNWRKMHGLPMRRKQNRR